MDMDMDMLVSADYPNSNLGLGCQMTSSQKFDTYKTHPQQKIKHTAHMPGVADLVEQGREHIPRCSPHRSTARTELTASSPRRRRQQHCGSAQAAHRGQRITPDVHGSYNIHVRISRTRR
jgi:hypothetical protein